MATYDVAQATTTSAERLLKADLLAPFPYHEFGIAKDEISFGSRLVPWFDLTRALGFNTKLVSKDQVPTTWEGLLDPKWKGRKIIVVGRGYPFGDLVPAWGLEKTLEYTRKFRAQGPIIQSRGGPQTLEALVAGQAPLALIQFDRVFRAKVKDKAPVGFCLDITHVGDSILLHRGEEGPPSQCGQALGRLPRHPRGFAADGESLLPKPVGPQRPVRCRQDGASGRSQADLERAPPWKRPRSSREWRKAARKILTGH